MSLSNEIIKVLDELVKKLGVSIDWTSENVMPYLQQLCTKFINYEMATSVLWLIIGVVFLFVGRWCFKKMQYYNEEYDTDVLIIFLGSGTFFTFLIGSLIVMYQINDIITCLTFPEKIIAEKLYSIMCRYN